MVLISKKRNEQEVEGFEKKKISEFTLDAESGLLSLAEVELSTDACGTTALLAVLYDAEDNFADMKYFMYKGECVDVENLDLELATTGTVELGKKMNYKQMNPLKEVRMCKTFRN